MTTLARIWPAVGFGAGVATSYLQGVLSGPWNTLANSGAVWTVIAFGVAAAAHVRGIATSSGERVLWVAAAVVVLTTTRAGLRARSTALLIGVLVTAVVAAVYGETVLG